MGAKRLIITFHGTTQAMAWEKKCKEQRIPGRLIPLPPEISAGCGLAWSAPLINKEIILAALGSEKSGHDQIWELER